MKRSYHPRLVYGRLCVAPSWLGRAAKLLICGFASGLIGLPTGAAESTVMEKFKEAVSSVQFGGFVSQGYIVNTGHNDYLGKTSEGTFDFREYAVNASYAIGQFRFGMQVFGQKLGEYGDDKLEIDWATADYQPAQWFGLRAGRVKTPRGLYNEALDLDSVRPFVLLPQSVYDARLRDFNSAFDGAMVLGNIGLKKFGSLDYRIYYGDIPLSTSSGASDYFNNDVPYANKSIGMDATYGGSLFWNPPIQGLKIGYSYTAFQNFTAARIIPATASGDAALATSGAATSIADRSTPLYGRHLISAEYTRGSWVFALEAGQDTAHYDISHRGAPGNLGAGAVPLASPPGEALAGAPAGPSAGAPVGASAGASAGASSQDFTARYGYVSVARRLNKHFEVGAYYSYSKDVLTGVSPYTLEQGDFAVSLRYDFNEKLLFKVEGHYMDGSGKLFDTAANRQPIADRDNSWFLLTLKATYSF